MKLFKLFIIFLLLFSFGNANEIKRKILVVVPYGENIKINDVHTKLEAILNYYGFFCEYVRDDGVNYPKNIDEYKGFIFWNQGLVSPNPLNLANFLTKFKDKKNIIIGDIPIEDLKNNNYEKEINKILKKNFYFSSGDNWVKNPTNLKKEYDDEFFGFEKKISFIKGNEFSNIEIHSDKIKTIFKEELELNNEKIISNSVFIAPWGFYGQFDKVFYKDAQINKNRWIINPFKMIEKVYTKEYPIPDTTTKNGKRIAYIHIDGDGILSKAFNSKYTIEVGYNFIKKQQLKTGVSFIVSELDKNGPILKNEYTENGSKKHDYKLLNDFAKEIYKLPFVEPATHTYSHPFNWREGIVAYSSNKNATKAIYNDIEAYQEPDKQVNLELEIEYSLNYLRKLTNKPINTVYWSGDCYPSKRDLQYIEKNKLLAFNGGDSRFDLEFNSYSYVTPLSLYSKEATQIYSSNSNENTYTNLWTENYWRFKNVVKTFRNTAYPKRIKPANTYYHFYSFAKKGSLNSLNKIYAYYKKNDFEFIYPSEFIKIAKNFHDIKIEQNKNSFLISNIKDLREFRFEGKKEVSSKDIAKVFYDKSLDVTYVRIKDKLNQATIIVNN